MRRAALVRRQQSLGRGEYPSGESSAGYMKSVTGNIFTSLAVLTLIRSLLRTLIIPRLLVAMWSDRG
jgi:hypothetical protein